MVHEDIFVLDVLEEQMYVFVNITCTCKTIDMQAGRQAGRQAGKQAGRQAWQRL